MLDIQQLQNIKLTSQLWLKPEYEIHPEVSGNFGRVIIENFVNCVDE